MKVREILAIGLYCRTEIYRSHERTALEKNLGESACTATRLEDELSFQAVLQVLSQVPSKTVSADRQPCIGVELRPSIVVPLQTKG